MIYVALFSFKDFFEPKLFKTLLDFGVIREHYEDLAYAAGLVDEFNLNTRVRHQKIIGFLCRGVEGARMPDQ